MSDTKIAKLDQENHIVWGWAYVVQKNGEQVIDHSEQMIELEEVQKAAHGFIAESRIGGVMHEEPAGEIVDSIFFSEELQKALDIDLGQVGWFIGFKVSDESVWSRVLDGELRMFSIGGTAKETPI